MQSSKVLFFILCTLLMACGTEPSGSDDPKTGERQVFHYNLISALTSLDPAEAKNLTNIWATHHLYDGLVQLDDDLNVRPSIAKNWEISEDGMTYTFHLRDDVHFHDDLCFPGEKGRKVVASDVVYSFNRIISPEVASPGSWIFKDRITGEEPFSAPDDSTFVLRLQQPFRPMLGILTMQYCSVVAREAVETYKKAFRSRPIGTGPFRLKNWLENQSLFLEKNPNYFGSKEGNKLPFLDAVRVSFMPDRKTAFLELLNGNLDMIKGLESSYVNELLTADGELRPDRAEQLQFLKTAFLNTEYLGINLELAKDNPLGNKKVRQALNYGFDRAQMLATLRNNVGKPANSGFTPIGLPSFNASVVQGYSYQPDKARALLAEAGYPNGKGLPEIQLMVNPDYQDLCVFITRQWADLGLKVKIEVTESATLRQMMSKGQAPFFRGSWIADYPDAESFFTVFYGKNPAPPNYTRFSNADFDRIYEQALNENDDEQRYALYHQLDQILVEEAPVIFLFYDETAMITQKRVQGLTGNAQNLLNLQTVEKH